MKLDLQRWRFVPLTLAGRVQCVKMNFLPQLLYVFMCLPLFLYKSFFHSIDSLISSFIWGSRDPHIKKSFLQRSRPKESLALPNFMFYYWAATFRGSFCGKIIQIKTGTMWSLTPVLPPSMLLFVPC